MQPKLVKRCLAALIMHACCQFAKFPLYHEEDQARVLYECNHVQIMALSQVGKAIFHTSRNHSVHAAAMVKHVLAQGQVRVRDLLLQFSAHEDTQDQDTSAAALEHRIIKLLHERYFVFAHPRDHIIAAEREREVRDKAKLDAKKNLSDAKLKQQIEEKVSAIMHRREREDNDKIDALYSTAVGLSSLDGSDHGPARKRVKMDNGSAATSLLDGDAIVRFNFDKLGVLARTRDLVSLCALCCGDETARIYGRLLDTLQLKTASCRQRGKLRVPITERHIARAIPDDMDLDDAWCTPPKSSRVAQNKRFEPHVAHTGYESDEIMSDEERSDESDMDEAGPEPSVHSKRILAILTGSHVPFVSQLTSTSYEIDFELLGEVLRERQVEALVSQQLGPTAVRLLRIIKEKRKVDEKQLYAIALLQHKDIRQALTSLHQLGVLELQEVPKRLDRQPSLTLFFWFHKPEKAAMTLASELCLAMARIHQRLEALLKDKSRLLAKSKRTDVRHREAELMSPAELRDLKGVYAMQERLLCQCARAYQAYQSLVQY
ncbi:RNA polymerase III subunit RPC82-domain-containing protein [Protomyces lactucae-debilis]|uniref:DNA-directed RNA polymerase III subunit RPC3 n=1 Tax=Protomyces lactucae-debilis TaxID=2754530 RepID=A0A1Y2EQM5_PROLT|nr:RNA polymerase III subunit RPC82-domain-containing protein [Protomyces lactucae-debilis]ORY73891.1 RNA polymerase III subunit RPC82-domain-containing protein [Protomyces lactucae-debilis]